MDKYELYALFALIDRGAVGLSGNQSTPEKVWAGMLNLAYYIGGIAAVIAIIYAGIQYITANGDASKIASAKNTIMYAVIGIIIIILANVITGLVVNTAKT